MMKIMKYKRHSYCLLQVLIIVLLCLPALISCDNDDVINQKEEKGLIIVNLSMDGLKTRAAGDPLFNGDDRIDRIRIFVFTGEALEKNQLFTIGNTEFNNPFVLEVATGLKDVYVVANESVDLGNRLLTVTTKSGLNSILADEISSSLSLPLVMTGIKTGVDVVEMEEPNHNFTDITLTRIVSKISLKFNKNTDADVAITKVSLLSNSKKTVIWNAVGVSGQTYWNWSYALPTPLVLSNTLTAISGQENIYLYENLAGSLNKGEAVQLEVEALYNNIETKYRVYVNEDIESPGSEIPGDPNSSVVDIKDHYYKIKRNYHYQLNGTIAGLGEFTTISVKVKILPWTIHEYPVPLE